jgi:hypothetical protein
MLPPERSGEMAASPIVRGGYGRAGIPTLRAAKGITSHQPLATSHCNSNRYTPRLEPPVTRSKQSAVVLSNRYKFVPSGGVASWLTHRPRRPFYPVQRESRNRCKPFPVSNLIFSTRYKKPSPRGVAFWLSPRQWEQGGGPPSPGGRATAGRPEGREEGSFVGRGDSG